MKLVNVNSGLGAIGYSQMGYRLMGIINILS